MRNLFILWRKIFISQFFAHWWIAVASVTACSDLSSLNGLRQCYEVELRPNKSDFAMRSELKENLWLGLMDTEKLYSEDIASLNCVISHSCFIHKLAKLFHQRYILLSDNDTIQWCSSASTSEYEYYRIDGSQIGEIGRTLLSLKTTGIKIFIAVVSLTNLLNIMQAAHIVEVSSDDYLWMVPMYTMLETTLEYQPINFFYLHVKMERYCDVSSNIQHDSKMHEVLSIKIRDKKNRLKTIGKLSDTIIEKSDELLKYTTNFRPNFLIKYPKIRIVTAIDPPFVSRVPLFKGKCLGRFCKKYVISKETNRRTLETFCCVGLCIDLMTYLETDMKAKFEVWLVEDGFYGAKINGTWNGMVSDVINDKADVIIAPFLMTRDRLMVLDFADESYLNGGMALATVVLNTKMTLFNFQTFQPLSYQMWFVVLSLTFFASVTVFFTEKFSHGKILYSLRESFTYFTGLTFQRDIGGENPVNFGSRVIGICVALFMLIVMSTYTAVLTSNMVTSTDSLPISGLKDEKIRNPTSNFKFGTQLNTAYVGYFAPSRDPQYHKTFTFMKKYNYADTSQAIEDLKAGRLHAIINDYYILAYYMVQEPDCKIRMIGKVVPDAGYTLAMAKGLPYKDVLSELIRIYKFDGTLERLQMKWFNSNCFDERDGERIEAERAGIISFGGLLIIAFGVCFVLVPLLFFLELWLHKFTTTDEEKESTNHQDKPLLIISK